MQFYDQCLDSCPRKYYEYVPDFLPNLRVCLFLNESSKLKPDEIYVAQNEDE